MDRDGRIIWARDTDTRVVGIQELNGTVLFGSGNSKVSAMNAGLIGGAIAAASYLFYRFFFFGAVARARARLDSNRNRNRVLEYIRKNPGASMFEIARDLSINMGTVRYHLLILSMNHRIVPFRADEKYVRYFTNAGSYGPEDQLMISLMRREPLKKILAVLQERPGLSNLELSRALDAHESSTMRNIKALIEKGVVNRSLQPDGKITYSINSKFCAQAHSALKLLDK
ncbi:MAG: Helix-turn-helix domain protein [Methanocella sp. PtaU1.Bin125]|nr:MAG: Helix-turn-helix domain protein [Methanocella sp. PtaU1.Bin125]